jgi:hypothetical protein
MAEIHPMEHKLTEAVEGQMPKTPLGAESGNHGHSAGRDMNPAQIAEEVRRKQEARPESMPDRDEKLVAIGRGEETAGRHHSGNRT